MRGDHTRESRKGGRRGYRMGGSSPLLTAPQRAQCWVGPCITVHRRVPSPACASWVGGAFARLCCSPASGSSVSKPSPRECPPAHPHSDEAITGCCRRCRPSCPPAHHPCLLVPTSHGGGATGSGGADGYWPPRTQPHTRVCSEVLLPSSGLRGIKENPSHGDLNERLAFLGGEQTIWG